MRRILKIIPASSLRYFFLLAVLLMSSAPARTFAVADMDFLQGNTILYYDPASGGMCPTVGSSYSTSDSVPSLSGSDNAEKIWNYLKGEGLSDESAAGIMGNLEQESGYNPDLTEGNGIGYGIIQWSFERRNGYSEGDQAKSPPPIGGLEKKALDLGVPASDLGFQLLYMKQEAETTTLIDFHGLFAAFGVSEKDNVWDIQKKQTAVDKATTFWHDSFERSNDYNTHGSIQHRIDYANAAYKKFTGKSAGSSNGSFGGSVCSAAGSGDLSAMTLEYAWPDWKGSGFIEPMPAYQAVIDKGPDFRDMGGVQHRGIDCVGFVTTLIIDSGFDPNFNHAGKYYGQPPSDGAGEDIERHWLESSESGWEKIASKGKLMNGQVLSSSDLQPGDVAVSDESSSIPGHTFAFVGTISGFNSQYASASMDDRAPMASSGDYESAANADFEWYRKVR